MAPEETALAAPATERAYASDMADFTAWADESGRPALPASPDDLAAYLTELAGPQRGLKASTISRRCSAISQAHRAAGLESPLHGVARDTLSHIRRTLGPPPNRVTSVELPRLLNAVEALPGDVKGARDRAFLLLGFAADLLRLELVALDVEHLSVTGDGLTLKVWRRKDAGASGRVVGVGYWTDPKSCPVRAVRAWLELAEITEGPLFRSLERGRISTERLSNRAAGQIIRAALEQGDEK